MFSTMPIAKYEVKRILIDNGSSANVLFFSVLKEMELDKSNIEHTGIVLTSFNGESTLGVWTLRLPVYAGGENKLFTFLIMDCLSAYNIILGRPWIHDMRAVPSTYH